MSDKKEVSWFTIIVTLGALTLGIVGWVLNMLTLFTADSGMAIGELILRVIGVIIPFIGAVLGFV